LGFVWGVGGGGFVWVWGLGLNWDWWGGRDFRGQGEEIREIFKVRDFQSTITIIFPLRSPFF